MGAFYAVMVLGGFFNRENRGVFMVGVFNVDLLQHVEQVLLCS